jgi:glutaminyl-tRNA synthetase
MASTDSATEEILARFNLESALKQFAVNPPLKAATLQTLAASGLAGADKAVGNLLFSVASAVNDARAPRRDFIARYIGAGKLLTTAQVSAAVDFVKKRTPDAELSVPEFEKACGAGVSFTPAQVADKAKEVVAAQREALLRDRYTGLNIGAFLAACKEGDWAWADGKLVKDSVDAEILALLGPKTAEDEKRDAEFKAAKKAAGGKAAAAGSSAAAGSAAAGPAAGGAASAASSSAGAGAGAGGVGVHRAGAVEQVFDARELKAAINTPELIAEHRAVTGGVVRTRFPPEPNGYLHIGHAKSMSLNFEMAFTYLGADKGETTFRYDDTNPDAESKEYIDNQAENVAWMGWRPVRVTHSSDYFDHLFAFAVRLITMGKAYVCHQTKEEMEASREIARARDGVRSPDSPWRNRPVEESLREFDAMRAGKYEEGKATLRLKIDMTSPNPTLWDPVAYRIKYTPHPHVGDKWCIYPSYDYSHSLIDSLEHIDYSLCTLEFEVRRDLYYWTLEQLNIWRPHVWEFARLNITHVQLSKRKILKLVTDKAVRGWDDPRIPTINGLRRRGYTPEAINNFCRDIGVTRHDNTVEHQKLEYHVRESGAEGVVGWVGEGKGECPPRRPRLFVVRLSPRHAQ